MNANELADSLDVESSQAEYGYIVDDWKLFRDAATMLRQQQDKLIKYELRHAEQRKRIEELERLIQELTQENHDLWEQLHGESFDRTASHMAGDYVAHPVKEEAEQQSYQEADGCPTELAVLKRFWRQHNPVKELTDGEIQEVWYDTMQNSIIGNSLIKFAKAILRKAQLTCNGFCGEYECKENKTNCLRKAQEK